MPTKVETFVDSNVNPAVRGMLHHPAVPSGDGLVITHGAGANCDWPLLVALAESLAEAGVTVLRCDLPFRQQRLQGPPRNSGAEDKAGLQRAVEALRPQVERIFLGGQSYGGRQASMLAADEPELVDGLLLLSYPLHAPGKPEQLRTKHFPQIKAPCLFVSGTKDPFGSPEDIQSAIELTPARTSFLQIEGGGHDLGYVRRVSKKMEDVPMRITAAFLALFKIRE